MVYVETADNQPPTARHDELSWVYIPMFLTPEEFGDGFDAGFTEVSDSHPSVNYSYDCADGHQAFVTHYVPADPRVQQAWQRDDFLGIVTENADDGSYFFDAKQNPDSGLDGYLEPTGLGGRYAGADYIHTFVSPETNSFVSIPSGSIRYGHYQYFSFTDQDGIEVDVLVQAPSFDFPEDSPIEDTNPTITTESTDPMVLVNHERVQARFECGRELAQLITTIVESLDHS